MSSTATVIHGEGLGKEYRRGVHADPGLRHALERIVRNPLSVFRRPKDEMFWALKDVSLQVNEGEVLGLIGRNGAGKTTLLKILSRITRPTTGWAEIRGRVGSLLEVGTGFHPELTGRENTFLSGAILGMSKREITAKFDEIVAFAELERFIDTPVKHYSSGMYVRLAFAVAAHLEPEILLVDEVLAVGDITFQKKCMGKMGDVARAGRTVVLVSHNMNAILTLCTRVVMLDEGRVVEDGRTSDVASIYFSRTLGASTSASDLRCARRTGTGKAKFSFVSVEVEDSSGQRVEAAYTGCNLRIQVEIECFEDIVASNIAIIIYDNSGYRLIDVNTAQKDSFVSLKAGEKARVRFDIRELLLKPGRYFIGLFIGRDMLEETDNIEQATAVDVIENVETTRHAIVFPGPYLCRFESSISLH
jgi:lipopolysaccharide transport system ATP-binding protein